MAAAPDLWIVTCTVPAALGEAFATDLENTEAVSVSVFAPPRQPDATVEAIFDGEPDRAILTARLSLVAALHRTDAPDFACRPSPPLDWLKKVAEDFPPLRLSRWTVHGAMHRDEVPLRLHALQIDATSAFGTGEHPTTRGCLAMLDRMLTAGFRPRRVADIGCGSGILSMAAAQAARATVVAVEMDGPSAAIARANARANGLGSLIRVRQGMGYAPPDVARYAPYDLIMANIFAAPLRQMAHRVASHLRPGGRAILAGLLNHQANGVIAAHRMQGLELTERRIDGEWSILALRKRGEA